MRASGSAVITFMTGFNLGAAHWDLSLAVESVLGRVQRLSDAGFNWRLRIIISFLAADLKNVMYFPECA